MLYLNRVHHIAIICSDYQRSLDFYTRVLGFRVLSEHYREARQSYKTDLHWVRTMLSSSFHSHLHRPDLHNLRLPDYVISLLRLITWTMREKNWNG